MTESEGKNKGKTSKCAQGKAKKPALSVQKDGFDEKVLTTLLNSLYTDIDIVQFDDPLKSINALADFLGLEVRVYEGCGVDNLINALSVIVEEYNLKCR